MSDDRTQPPAGDELELSLFGPGVGECAVVHLGGGRWCVVDSCRDSDGAPVAASYLRSLGVALKTQVVLVVVSHWHDDHISGVADLLQEADGASFVCSAALNCKEFAAFIAAGRSAMLVEQSSGVAEMHRALRIQGTRRGSAGLAGPDHWAAQGTSLFKANSPLSVELIALSPSAQSITDTKHALGNLIPKPGQVTRRFPSPAPNQLATVLRLETEPANLLLGADLETGTNALRGWRAVIGYANNRPKCLSHAYKVAHHGSANGDCDGIWSDLLAANPVAVLSPYARGKRVLPSGSDVSRLIERTNHVYCTAWPARTRPPRRHNSVERTMRECTIERHAIRRTPGQVRIRIKQSAGRGGELAPSISLFDGACDLHASPRHE